VTKEQVPKVISTGLNAGTGAYGRIVGADGVYFILDSGRRLIDASNTAAPLGHGHPSIVRAVRAAAAAPAINEGWDWPERETAAQELLTTFGADADWAGAVKFCLSGSEANDLALSLSQALTGRSRLATRERAYHGIAGLARDVTVQPHWHGGISSSDGRVRSVPRGLPVVELPRSVGARIVGQGIHSSDGAANILQIDLQGQLHDTAAVIIDYSQGGMYHTVEYQDTVAEAAHKAGALWIADEVVTGFGRTGGWYAFQKGTTRPDIVTLGKPIAGGIAGGAVVLSKELAEEVHDGRWRTYSTFRGHPVTIAATRANLEFFAREGLAWRADEADQLLFDGLRLIADRHPSVARIDGRGMHWTVELVGPDWRSWTAAVDADPLATRVSLRAAEAGVLIGTSGEQTSLFIAPPLIATDDELLRILDTLDSALLVADAELVAA
jgi:4-aminobutyrate aminotransferase-like enzyme